MPLHVEVRGQGPPVVLLHGFTQTGRLWGHFGEHLSASCSLVAVDLPGHAGSDDVRADLAAAADLVTEAVRATVGDATPVVLLGYSLGARMALYVALGTDLLVDRLVLIGGTGGMEDAAERERRRAADNERADQLEASGDVEGFLAEWLRGPLFARLAPDQAAVDERLRNSAAGLASSLRLCGTGTQLPLWDQLVDLACPLLALAGTDDTRFAAHALRMAQLAPEGVATLVPGGGHAVHLAQPAPVARLVQHWLAALPSH